MNAHQIYELVKGWKDHWPEGLEYTPCQTEDAEGNVADLPMWTLDLDGISAEPDESEAWKDEDDNDDEAGCSILTPIAAARMLTDRACELAGCGLFQIGERFLAFDADGDGMGDIVNSRLAAACEGLKCRKARQAKKKGGGA